MQIKIDGRVNILLRCVKVFHFSYYERIDCTRRVRGEEECLIKERESLVIIISNLQYVIRSCSILLFIYLFRTTRTTYIHVFAFFPQFYIHSFKRLSDDNYWTDDDDYICIITIIPHHIRERIIMILV